MCAACPRSFARPVIHKARAWDFWGYLGQKGEEGGKGRPLRRGRYAVVRQLWERALKSPVVWPCSFLVGC